MGTVLALVLVAVGVAACGGGDDKAEAKPPKVYFGWMLGTSEPTAVAIDTDAPAGDGKRGVRIYVCDGLGPPAGQAVWFKGTVDPKVVNGVGSTAHLESAGKRETIDVNQFDDRLIKGSYNDGRGRDTQFVAYPAHDGAGIYEVTLDEKLRYTGTSTDGSKVAAQAGRDGLVTGTLDPADGDAVKFAIRTLALASPAELRAAGLSSAYKKDIRHSLVPGEYVAVIAPGGTHWLGRAGNVRLGSPLAEIIGLDKKELTNLSRTQLNVQQVGALSP
jgi:hypothetical protein